MTWATILSNGADPDPRTDAWLWALINARQKRKITDAAFDTIKAEALAAVSAAGDDQEAQDEAGRAVVRKYLRGPDAP
jgi:hypothetical protein